MIIGITGRKYSGKDTLATMFNMHFNFVTYAFADPIKEAAKAIFLFDNGQLYTVRKDEIDERWGIKPRDVFQHLGTEWAQYSFPEAFPYFKEKISRNLWTTRFKIWYEKEIKKNSLTKVVVTDVRFKHEHETIKELNGYIVKIERPDLDECDFHESETTIDSLDYDYLVINDSSIGKLQDEAFKIFDNICRKLKRKF